MVGLAAAEQLAHHLESYLRELREGTLNLTESGFEALVAGVSLLEGVINARRNDQPIPSIDEIVDRLQAVSSSPSHFAFNSVKNRRTILQPAVGRSSLRPLRNLPSAELT